MTDSFFQSIRNNRIPLAIITLGTVLATYFISHTYWAADDFAYMQRFADQPLSWEFITTPFDNHLVPLFVATWWAVNKIAQGNYTYAAVIMVLGFITLHFSFLKLLKQFSLSDIQRNILVAVFVFASLILHNFFWWAAFLSSIVPLIFIINFLTYSMKYYKDTETKYLVVSLLCLTVASLYFEKMMMYSGVLFLFLVLVHGDFSVTCVKNTILRLRWMWVGLTGIVGVLMVMYVQSGALETVSSRPTPSSLFSYLKVTWFQYFIPQVFGIRYLNIDVFGNSTLTIVFGVVVTFLVGLFLLKCKYFGLRVAMFFGIVFIIAESAAALGRLTYNGYGISGEMRYHLDSFLVFCISIAAVTAYLSRYAPMTIHRSISFMLCTLFVLFLSLNIYTAHHDLTHSIGYQTKIFHNNIRNIDHQVAETRFRIMHFSSLKYNLLSNVLAATNTDIDLTDVAEHAVLPNGTSMKARDLFQFGKIDLLRTKKCSINGSLTVDIPENNAGYEYVVFNISSGSKNLSKISLDGSGHQLLDLDFTPNSVSDTSYVFSPLYTLTNIDGTITFITRQEVCLDSVIGVPFIYLDK